MHASDRWGLEARTLYQSAAADLDATGLLALKVARFDFFRGGAGLQNVGAEKAGNRVNAREPLRDGRLSERHPTLRLAEDFGMGAVHEAVHAIFEKRRGLRLGPASWNKLVGLAIVTLAVTGVACGSATLKTDAGTAGATGTGGTTGAAGTGGSAGLGGATGTGGNGGRAAPAGGHGGGSGGASGSRGVAGEGDAGSGPCAASGSNAVAILDCPCSSPGKLACNGNAQPVTLICSQGAWTLNQTCSGTNLCDSLAGTCQPVDPLCQSATAGQTVCDGSANVVQCGVDRVSHTTVKPCTGAAAACLNGACVACAPTTTRSCGPCNDGTESCNSSGAWSGTCVGGSDKHVFYRDADTDGYGNPALSVTVCGAKPAGYVDNSTDCCDSDANAHPGQTAFFPAPDACGSSQVPDGYDYNCDGKDTLEYANLNTSCKLLSSGSCGCAMCACDGNDVCGLSCTASGVANPPCGAFGIHSSGVNIDSYCQSSFGGGKGIQQQCN